jgi:uncharacterized Tic20 family protein
VVRFPKNLSEPVTFELTCRKIPMSIATPSIDEQPCKKRNANLGSADHDNVRSNGRLHEPGVSQEERNFAVAMHLSPLAVFFLPIAVFAPLVIWLFRKDKSAFNDDHGKEVVNFLLSFVVLQIALIVSCVLVLTIPFAVAAMIVLLIVGVINVIRGAVAAAAGEYFRYPMTIRFLS